MCSSPVKKEKADGGKCTPFLDIPNGIHACWSSFEALSPGAPELVRNKKYAGLAC
jgi:hypothetical protein